VLSSALTRRLRWADTDATGYFHFPRLFEVIEEAETELLRAAGYQVDVQSSPYRLPRVRVECSWQRGIRHDEEYTLRMTVGRLGRTSITYEFVVEVAGDVAAQGSMTVVFLKDGMPAEVPTELRAALSEPVNHAR
jgi:YbgC/YbaW family acyl-CoA thioester hydrolase